MCFFVCVIVLFSVVFLFVFCKTFVMLGYANEEFEFEFEL